MNIAEQIKWINDNQEWLESLNPYSFRVDRQKGKVSIHASNNEETKKYFRDNIRKANADWTGSNKFYCTVLGKKIDVATIFTGEEVKELGIDRFGMPF